MEADNRGKRKRQPEGQHVALEPPEGKEQNCQRKRGKGDRKMLSSESSHGDSEESAGDFCTHDRLPVELWGIVLSLLPTCMWPFCLLVCKEWREVMAPLRNSDRWLDAKHFCAALAANGFLSCLKLARHHGCPWGWNVCAEAARRGHLDVLRYVCEAGVYHSSYDLCAAAAGGHIDCLRYLREERGCSWDGGITEDAAKHGHLAVLEYSHAAGGPWSIHTCTAAIKGGHMDCLRFAHEHGCPWTKKRFDHPDDRRPPDHPKHEYACVVAVEHARLDCLRYLHEQGCCWSARTCREAAEAGALDCLRYLHENGCAWDPITCERAARRGHLETLAYAHERGCPWNARTFLLAAKRGNLEILRYLHDESCPSSEDAAFIAAKRGHLEMLQFLCEHGHSLRRAAEGAALNGDIACLVYAHRHGAAWNAEVMLAAAGNPSAVCLRYAHENGLPWSTGVCAQAARFGSVECLRYAHEHGCPWVSDTLLAAARGPSGHHSLLAAARKGHLACLRYAHRNGCPMPEEPQRLVRRAVRGAHPGCLRYLMEECGLTSLLAIVIAYRKMKDLQLRLFEDDLPNPRIDRAIETLISKYRRCWNYLAVRMETQDLLVMMREGKWADDLASLGTSWHM